MKGVNLRSHRETSLGEKQESREVDYKSNVRHEPSTVFTCEAEEGGGDEKVLVMRRMEEMIVVEEQQGFRREEGGSRAQEVTLTKLRVAVRRPRREVTTVPLRLRPIRLRFSPSSGPAPKCRSRNVIGCKEKMSVRRWEMDPIEDLQTLEGIGSKDVTLLSLQTGLVKGVKLRQLSLFAVTAVITLLPWGMLGAVVPWRGLATVAVLLAGGLRPDGDTAVRGGVVRSHHGVGAVQTPGGPMTCGAVSRGFLPRPMSRTGGGLKLGGLPGRFPLLGAFQRGRWCRSIGRRRRTRRGSEGREIAKCFPRGLTLTPPACSNSHSLTPVPSLPSSPSSPLLPMHPHSSSSFSSSSPRLEGAQGVEGRARAQSSVLVGRCLVLFLLLIGRQQYLDRARLPLWAGASCLPFHFLFLPAFDWAPSAPHARSYSKSAMSVSLMQGWSRSMNLLGLGLNPMAFSRSASLRFSCSCWRALLATSSCSSSSSLRPRPPEQKGKHVNDQKVKCCTYSR
ncbi:hypothetical protein F7725_014470 [Dissostichus mawsoni]|uniref:Uncharacterized protein n=1 Tax=Dissostichus mawsoni TaxID=36200 RepID=A0A7J5YW05_DISMA|nr:hypothetical protein F7725_014470 [Dissostichus mawsoni]